MGAKRLRAAESSVSNRVRFRRHQIAVENGLPRGGSDPAVDY